jgi:hypothetical protein
LIRHGFGAFDQLGPGFRLVAAGFFGLGPRRPGLIASRVDLLFGRRKFPFGLAPGFLSVLCRLAQPGVLGPGARKIVRKFPGLMVEFGIRRRCAGAVSAGGAFSLASR